MYFFTDRVEEVGLVQLNTRRQNLSRTAAKWQDYELDSFSKEELRHLVVGVAAWIDGLVQRFCEGLGLDWGGCSGYAVGWLEREGQ